MLESIFAFGIIIGIFSLGDFLGLVTKAKMSAVFVVMIGFLLLFLFKIVPTDIINISGLTVVAKWASPILVFHMGTLINIKELLDEWKTVVTAVIGMFVACLSILAVIPIIGREAAFVSIPVINGGLIATQIMTDSAMAKGFTLAAALGPLVYAIQKFVGAPVVSACCLKEANVLLKDFRDKKISFDKNALKKDNKSEEKSFADKYYKYFTPFSCLFIATFFAWLSVVVGDFTKVNYSIIALIFGVALSSFGLIPKKLLDVGKSSGFINMVVFASLIPSLARVSFGDLAQLSIYVLAVFGATLLGTFLVIYLLPVWKIVGSRNFAFAIALTQMLGFPSTYLISNEVATAISQNEEEKEFVMSKIMPKIVVAGLASVTTLSIVIAGIFASIL